MSDVKCAYKDCDLSGRWIPVLLIRPSASIYAGGVVPENAVARGQAGMPLCDVHKALANVDDFCTPEGFAMISAGFQAKGFAAPDPDVGLDFDPLPTCGAGSTCSNPAVVQIIWQADDGGASLRVCAEHLPNVRRILIEHAPGEGVERQEMYLVPQELWR